MIAGPPGTADPKWLPAATASRYQLAWGSHCSPQRQSLSAPVTVWGRLKSMPWGSENPPVTPLTIPPGAFVYSGEPK